MTNKILFLFTFLICFQSTFSQNRFWVFFSDKHGETFNPEQYFDAKAIERRVNQNITLFDSTDFPVRNDYIQAVKNEVIELSTVSRWFNCVAVLASNEQIEKVEKLRFVIYTQPIVLQAYTCESPYDSSLTVYKEDLLRKQTERMQGSLFEKHNLRGKGMRIAIFDAGFPSVDTNPVFAHIRNAKRILKTYDFTKKSEFVYAYNSHGTSTFSCLAGITNGIKIGLAAEAEFLLARTEVESEPFSEEENWLAAVEWADKNGANIISSSLGYTYHRYFQSQMDGKTSLVVKAANLAAKKGILVFNSIGNDGTNNWKTVGTPADADSVLSIGGIDPATDFHISFSSFGPTADKRLKPNVCAYGLVIAAGTHGLTQTQGTSFSCPLAAGFAACAWQNNPKLTNMEMFKLIEQSADLYPYYDYAHGYGVPQASFFVEKDSSKKTETPTFEFKVADDTVYVIVNKEFVKDKTLSNLNQIFDKEFSVPEPENILYYHLQENNGVLLKYYVIEVSQCEVLKYPTSYFSDAKILRVHYKGYTGTFQF